MMAWRLFYVAALVFATGCSGWRAAHLARTGAARIKKAIQIDPSIARKLERIDTIRVIVPGHKDSTVFRTVMDTVRFYKDIKVYDSLIISSGTGTGAVRAARKNLFRGYARDSTYSFEDERLKAEISIRKNGVFGFSYFVKPQSRDTTVAVTETRVALPVKKRFFDGIKDAIKWVFIGAFIGLLVLLLLKIKKRP